MTNRIDNLRQILDQMEVCYHAKEDILAKFGERPKVTKANLRKAIDYRSVKFFLDFTRIWLGMDYQLQNWLLNRRDHFLWNARHTRNMQFHKREQLSRKIILEAVYAYYQEWRKP